MQLLLYSGVAITNFALYPSVFHLNKHFSPKTKNRLDLQSILTNGSSKCWNSLLIFYGKSFDILHVYKWFLLFASIWIPIPIRSWSRTELFAHLIFHYRDSGWHTGMCLENIIWKCKSCAEASEVSSRLDSEFWKSNLAKSSTAFQAFFPWSNSCKIT